MTLKNLPGERSVGVKSTDEMEAGESEEKFEHSKSKGWVYGQKEQELRLSVWRSCSTGYQKKRSQISTTKKKKKV